MDIVLEPKRTKTEEEIQDDINILKEWIKKQPHLPNEFDDEILLAFIHGSKSLERAKKQIDCFCTVHTKYPDDFGFPARDPLSEYFVEGCKFMKMFVLRDALPNGLRVIMSKVMDAEKFDERCNLRRVQMLRDLVLSEHPETRGFVFFVDGSLSDVSMITKMSFKNCYVSWQCDKNTTPLRAKLFVIYNPSGVSEFAINNLAKPLYGHKINKLVHIAKEGESVFKKFLPLEFIPCDFLKEGKAPSSDELNDYWLKKMAERRDWFLKLSKLCSDEDKRPPDEENTYGVEGTFRKLNVD